MRKFSLPKLRKYPLTEGCNYWFYCPGCKCDHSFYVTDTNRCPAWTFNGDFKKPTFEPSLLYPDRRCHLYVRDGIIEFLSDCSHELAGKHIVMEEIEENPSY